MIKLIPQKQLKFPKKKLKEAMLYRVLNVLKNYDFIELIRITTGMKRIKFNQTTFISIPQKHKKFPQKT
jgi:Fe2+ or Zn2+ uptake regulation protein